MIGFSVFVLRHSLRSVIHFLNTESPVMNIVSPNLRSTHSLDGAIALDLRSGQMFHANFVGSRILELLRSGASEAQVIETISAEFGADKTVVERDFKEFIDALEKHGLIEVAHPDLNTLP